MVLVGRRLSRACALAVVVCLGLVSCGSEESPTATSSSASPTSEPSDDGSPTPSGEPVPPGTPVCADVWQDGAELGRAYAGCDDGGVLVEREGLGCSSGQRLVTYADHFYAVLGGEIRETERPLDRDRGYVRTVRGCRA